MPATSSAPGPEQPFWSLPIQALAERWSGEGDRMLALMVRRWPSNAAAVPRAVSLADEAGMVFLGLVALSDPIKAGVVVTLALPGTGLGRLMGFVPLPPRFLAVLVLILLACGITAELVKRSFYRWEARRQAASDGGLRVGRSAAL